MGFIQTIETDVKKIAIEIEGWVAKISPEFRQVTQEAITIAPEVTSVLKMLLGILGPNPELTAAINLIQKFTIHVSSGGVLNSSPQLETTAETAALQLAKYALPNASPEALTTAIGLAAGSITKAIADSQVTAAAK